MYSLKEELLIKAQRDKSKLVQVQRTVSRGGRTFTQNFWVLSSQVKKTDRVIGGQQNLLPAAGSVAAPAAGVLDKAYLDSIKSDKTKALAYIKSCGVTWKEHPTHDGVNWMRAMMAVSAALNGQKTVNISSTQVTTQTAKPTQQIAQNFQVTVDKAKADAMLDQTTKDELAKCKNGREKVVVLKKKLGQDRCIKYAKMMGISWNEHTHPAINIMRMSMALQQSFDVADGTVSPKSSDGKKHVGAPDGNQNAKKNNTAQDTPKPAEPETIEITDKMTPRQKNLAQIINTVSSAEDLSLFKSTGIVAEDDTAKDFLKKTLKPAYYDTNSNNKGFVGSRQRYFNKETLAGWMSDLKPVSGTLTGLPNKCLKAGIEAMLYAHRGDETSLSTSMLVCPRQTTSPFGLSSRVYSPVHGAVFSDCQDHASLPNVFDVLSQFSQFSSDEEKNNRGYQGYNAQKCQEQYDKFGLHAYGVVSTIDYIAEKQPDLKTEADSMISDYQKMLELCGKSPNLLYNILSNNVGKLEDNKDQIKEASVYASALYKATQELYNKYGNSWDMTIGLNNPSPKSKLFDIVCDLLDGMTTSYLIDKNTGRYIKDDLGNNLNVIDFINKSTGIDFSNYHNRIKLSSYKHLIATYCVLGDDTKSFDTLQESDLKTALDAGILSVYEKERASANLTNLEQIKAYNNISDEDFSKIRNLMLSFSGQKVQKISSDGSSYQDVDTSQWSKSDWLDFDHAAYYYKSTYDRKYTSKYVVVPNSANPQKDRILSNIHYICVNHTLKDAIHDSVMEKGVPSKANQQGSDWFATFDYMDTADVRTLSQPFKGYYSYSPNMPKTPSEINKKIKTQLYDTPLISQETMNSLQKFIETQSYQYSIETLSEPYKSQARADACSINQGNIKSVDAIKNTPFHDLITQQLQSVAHLCPQMKNARTKTNEDIDHKISEKIGNVPYGSAVAQDGSLKGLALKQLREEVLSKVHCSLKTSDDQEKTTIETRIKHDWDKEKRDTNGKRLYGYISFKSGGVYKINNSEADEIFRDNVKKTGETPVSLFHGTNFRGATGIIGVDGKFRAPKNAADAAKNGQKYAGGMLGPGVYLADLAGKSAGYFGTWGAGYNKRGALLVCDAILGNHVTADNYASVSSRMDCDSVSMRAGTNTGRVTLRADEWCIRRNDYVSPQYLIDAEAVSRNS